MDLKIETQPLTLRQLAVDRLREAIMTGTFKGGHRLVERTLCDQMGVSRSVIREVLRFLEAEGLVEYPDRGGPIVAKMDWNRAKQIYDIRLLLESDAAAACARRADAALKTTLGDALKDLAAAVTAQDTAGQLRATANFYELIFTAAGQDIAWEVVNRLNGRISLLRAMTLTSPSRTITGPARMQAILTAIQNNDAKAAARAVRDHLTDASKIAQKLLTEDPE